MAEFVSDCPRCGALRATTDVFSSVVVGARYKWQQIVELSCICRTCHKMSVHLVARKISSEEVSKYFGALQSRNTTSAYKGSLNDLVAFMRHVTLRDRDAEAPPEHLPEDIERVMREANTCLSCECWNAAASMYRLALDMATKTRLPKGDQPNARIRRSLGLRLEWLFDQNRLPPELKQLASCVHQDGNDGTHDGTLGQADAEDLRDFSNALLRRLYTEPARLDIAERRREERRAK